MYIHNAAGSRLLFHVHGGSPICFDGLAGRCFDLVGAPFAFASAESKTMNALAELSSPRTILVVKLCAWVCGLAES